MSEDDENRTEFFFSVTHAPFEHCDWAESLGDYRIPPLCEIVA